MGKYVHICNTSTCSWLVIVLRGGTSTFWEFRNVVKTAIVVRSEK